MAGQEGVQGEGPGERRHKLINLSNLPLGQKAKGSCPERPRFPAGLHAQLSSFPTSRFAVLQVSTDRPSTCSSGKACCSWNDTC